jgi:hypothetical protein
MRRRTLCGPSPRDNGAPEGALLQATSRKTSTAQEGAEPKQQKARLVQAEEPKHSSGIIPRVCFEILTGAGIQKIHKARVVSLSEIVENLANQQMQI